MLGAVLDDDGGYNVGEGFRLLLRAMAQGHPDALYRLAENDDEQDLQDYTGEDSRGPDPCRALELATIGDHVRAALALGRRLLAEGDDVLALRWFEVAAARGGIIARRDVAAALRDRPALEQRAWAEAIEAGDPYAVHQFGLELYTRGEVERAEGVWAASARAAVAEKMCCVANALEFTDPDRARAWSRRDRNVDGLAYDGRSRQDTADLRIEHVDAAETATRTCASAGELVACVGGPMTGGSLRVSPGEGTPGA